MSKHRKNRNSSHEPHAASDSSNNGPSAISNASIESLRSNVGDLATNGSKRAPRIAWGLVSCFAGGMALGLGAGYFSRRARLPGDAFDEFFDDDRPVIDVMTAFPTVCTPETPISEIARRMVDTDCGAIPIVEDEGSRRPIGIVTDRDIVVRTLAEGRNPMQLVARDCMTPLTITVPDTATVFECVDMMRENQIRRLVVVDEDGRCAGIVAQADIALELSPTQTQELVGEVSAATGTTRGPAAA